MKVLNAAVHKLLKLHNDETCTRTPSNGLLVIEAQLEHLVSQIISTYDKQTGQRIGAFQDEAHHLFPSRLRDALSGPDAFFDFSKWALDQLHERIKKVYSASSGYLFFCLYEVPRGKFFLVAKLTDAEGAAFSADMTRAIGSTHLNVRNLQQVGRVNLAAWDECRDSYLTFVSAKGDDGGSNYFADFLGCRDKLTTKDETQKLVSVIMDFCVTQGLDEKASAAVRSRAFAYASEQPKGEPMSLGSLARATWPDSPDEFMTFLNGHENAPTDGFVAVPSRLKGLVSCRLEMKGLTIDMSDEFRLSHSVHIADGNTLVIHNVSPEIVRAIKGGGAA